MNDKLLIPFTKKNPGKRPFRLFMWPAAKRAQLEAMREAQAVQVETKTKEKK